MKIVCSKPCHARNLLSTAMKDYLYNHCTGYHQVNQLRAHSLERPGKFMDMVVRLKAIFFCSCNKIVGLWVQSVGAG
jgi:hypothetical protein